jgi:hypothetical protein
MEGQLVYIPALARGIRSVVNTLNIPTNVDYLDIDIDEIAKEVVDTLGYNTSIITIDNDYFVINYNYKYIYIKVFNNYDEKIEFSIVNNYII